LENPIVLKRDVTIRGTSSEEVTVECATDLCVFMIRGGAPKLKNLTIINRGKSAYDNAVFVENGVLEMNGCTLISDYGYGIHVYTKNARAKVHSCVVKSCGCCGIRLASNASGGFTYCKIFNNIFGVMVTDSSESKFENCDIDNNEKIGIATSLKGHGHFQNCVIS
ncbi:MAG: right-handed parallel beta-helix repeat-containing protein, partial [Planctomycetia bacterium]|nr:right-handed parallel beta-helix repeat-containing protein [Planctomycetia bacterium]